MSAGNVRVVRRWFEEVWNERRDNLIEELTHPDGVSFSVAGEVRGTATFRERVYGPFLAAFPDLQIEVVGTVAEGDEVVVRWIARGTHTGDGLGLPPTGKRVSFRGLSWIRLRDGRMAEGWDCWDLGGLRAELLAAEAGPGLLAMAD